MNCENFETIVNDLATVKAPTLMDAVARERGLAHAETCARCAARLADERALTAGLRALSACDERKVEPDSVEAALIGAFRAQASSPIARRFPVQSRSRLRWSLAAAAAILIAFGFIVYRAIQNESDRDNSGVTDRTPAPQPPVKREKQPAKESFEPESHRGRRAPRLRRGNRPRPDAPIVPEIVVAEAKDSEDTTDFILLRYGDDYKPMENGELIRVQMPSSALIALGLPVNVENADKPVKADLLIGEDGLARAIRFVR